MPYFFFCVFMNYYFDFLREHFYNWLVHENLTTSLPDILCPCQLEHCSSSSCLLTGKKIVFDLCKKTFSLLRFTITKTAVFCLDLTLQSPKQLFMDGGLHQRLPEDITPFQTKMRNLALKVIYQCSVPVHQLYSKYLLKSTLDELVYQKDLLSWTRILFKYLHTYFYFSDYRTFGEWKM